MNTQRPPTVTVAAILLALLSALGFVFPVLFATEGIPAFAIYGGAALNAFGLVAAYGLWTLKRWSMALTLIASVLNILLSAPGMFFAPTATLQILNAVGVVVFALIIVLVALPISRRAHA